MRIPKRLCQWQSFSVTQTLALFTNNSTHLNNFNSITLASSLHAADVELTAATLAVAWLDKPKVMALPIPAMPPVNTKALYTAQYTDYHEEDAVMSLSQAFERPVSDSNEIWDVGRNATQVGRRAVSTRRATFIGCCRIILTHPLL